MMRNDLIQDLRHNFFYAEEEVDLYDDLVELTQPLYWLLHSTIVDLLAYYFDASEGRSQNPGRPVILDAGCGTGAEGLAALKTFPDVHLVALDLSQRMLEKFREKLVRLCGLDSKQHRCRLVAADLLSPDTEPDKLLALLPAGAANGAYDVVVTAFTLHHFSLHEKRGLYRRFCSILKPGGLLVNGDLFAFESPTLSRVARHHEEHWIWKQFTEPNPEYAAKAGGLGRRRLELRDAWLKHLRDDNRPLPIEGDHVSGEADVLKEIGFSEVGCPFRYFQAGILWARK
jgi:tRNA (cmo5U34)-methyltransferase